jgi:hypothetical protein
VTSSVLFEHPMGRGRELPPPCYERATAGLSEPVRVALADRLGVFEQRRTPVPDSSSVGSVTPPRVCRATTESATKVQRERPSLSTAM